MGVGVSVGVLVGRGVSVGGGVPVDEPVGEGVRVWTSPAVVDGVVYFGSHDGHVYSIGASN